MIQEIIIPFKEKVSIITRTSTKKNGSISNSIISIKYAIDNDENFILNEPSSDTIYSIGINKILKPLIIRSPAISEMNPQVLLTIEAKVGNYLFMRTYNKGNVTEWGSINPVELVYNYKENKVYKYNGVFFINLRRMVFNEETASRQTNYTSETETDIIIPSSKESLGVQGITLPTSFSLIKKHHTQKNVIISQIHAAGLNNLYKKNEDTFGKKHKEIISKIEEDDNLVLVKIKLEE
jgi:hypothetical protein